MRDWIAAATLFAATAGVVLWQNAHVAVLFDLSYILNTAERIALGQVPYRNFPLPHPPLTFLLQAAIIRLTGRVFFHHVLYVAITGGLGTVLAWRIALASLRGRAAAAWTLALLLAAPLIFLGIYCIVPNPEYDCDCGFWILVALWAFTRLDRRKSALFAFAAGALACVPMFFKQNMGLPFLVVALGAVLLLLVITRLTPHHPAQTPGAPCPSHLGTWEARTQPRAFNQPHNRSRLSLPAHALDCWLRCWRSNAPPVSATIITGPSNMQANAACRDSASCSASTAIPRWRGRCHASSSRWCSCGWDPGDSGRTSPPSLCSPHRFSSRSPHCCFTTTPTNAATPCWRFGRCCSCWPPHWRSQISSRCVDSLTLRIFLPLLLLAAIHGTFLSQQLWGSTYGIWPLLILLLAELLAFLGSLTARANGNRWFTPALAAIISITLLICGGFYTVSEERLNYANLPDGAPAHSAFPALAGLATPGPYLPEIDELLRYAQAKIPFDDGIVSIPGEEPFYFATGRTPQFPVPFFDPTIDPYSSAEIADLVRARNIRWLIVKTDMQTKEDPTPDRAELMQLLMQEFTPAAHLRGYDVYRR